MYAVDQYDDQGTGHDDTLDQISGTCGQKSAQGSVSHDNDGTYDHGRHIRNTEECGKEFAAGSESGRSVRYKENYDHDGRNCQQGIAFIPVAVCKKRWDRNGIICFVGIAAQTFCDDEPVQISSDSKSDGSPSCFGTAGQICDTRQTHQKPAAHVRGFGTHSSHDRTKLSSTQIKITGVVVFSGKENTDQDHGTQIDDHDDQHSNCVCIHKNQSPLLRYFNKFLPVYHE